MAATRFSLQSLKNKSSKFLVAWLLVLIQITAIADSSLSLNTYYYDLQPGLSILKPSINYENDLSEDSSFNARLTVDRVKTEPVDAISSASQTMGATIAKTDIRQEYLIGGSHLVDNWKVGAGFLVSLEKDYRSYSPSMLISKDFNQRNTTLTFTYAHNFDWIKGEYMSEEKKKDVDHYSLALTQVLDRHTIFQVSYSQQINQGFLATGNRKLVLANGLSYDEYLPSYRNRQAIGIRLAHWLQTETAVQFSYQHYFDSWEMTSDAVDVSVNQRINTQFTLRGEARYYEQSKVYFSKSSYTGAEKYLTTANSLSAFDSQLVGMKLIYTPARQDNYQISLGWEKYRQNTGLTGSIYLISLNKQY